MRILVLLAVAASALTPSAGALVCPNAPECTIDNTLDGDLAVDACEAITNPAFPFVGGQTQLARPACPVVEGLPWPGGTIDPFGDEPFAQDPFCASFPVSFEGFYLVDLQCEDLFTIDAEYAWRGTTAECTSSSDCTLASRSVGRLGATLPGTWRLEVDSYLYYHTIFGTSPKVPGSDVHHVCEFEGPGECERATIVEGVRTNSFIASVRGVSTFRTYWTPSDGVPVFVTEHTNCQLLWGLGNSC